MHMVLLLKDDDPVCYRRCISCHSGVDIFKKIKIKNNLIFLASLMHLDRKERTEKRKYQAVIVVTTQLNK